MLTRLGPTVCTPETAGEPLFPQKLEFNPPVHENWNIVHIAMQIPEAHQIYVCGINCMRGVVLTAAEMAASERFSFVLLKEEDVVDGTVWEATRNGIADVLRKLPELPKCVVVFPVCTHHFMGVDMESIYRSLEKEFPGVTFIRAWMDPIMAKHGLAPDQRLRKVMYDPLPAVNAKEKTVTVLGAEFALEPDADIRRLLSENGYAIRELQDCRTYDDYLRLAEGETFLVTSPGGKYGVTMTAKRLNRPCYFLPMSFDYESIAASLETLTDALQLEQLNIASERQDCDARLELAREEIGNTPIVIDSLFHPRPLQLAKLLISHGFRVTEVYLDAVDEAEKPALAWLKEHSPDLELRSIILPEQRVADRTRPEKTLAIGPKAAWFTSTPYFVNVVQGGGLWGYAGIRTLCSLMIDAFRHEKDTRDIVPRKGWGCVSCI